jgi:hypothetical protein
MRSIYPISGVSLKAQKLEVYKREGSSGDGMGLLGGGLLRFGALGQLDALACMTEYAQARPTLSTSSPPPPPKFGQDGSTEVGKKETGVSEMGGVAPASPGIQGLGGRLDPTAARVKAAVRVGEKMRS